MEQASSPQLYNKALVQASFERWENGTGGPFELLAPDAEWTIVIAYSVLYARRPLKELIYGVRGDPYRS
jgi:ketosteroid isomerase-like protein